MTAIAMEDPPTLVWRSRVLTIPSSRQSVLHPFPFDPVFDLCLAGRSTVEIEDRVGLTAKVLDVDRGRVYRWLRSGLSIDQADVIAIMFGLHPCLVWSDWFTHALRDEKVSPPRPYRRGPRRLKSTSMEDRLAELMREGRSFGEIAQMMAGEGWRTRSGREIWTAKVAYKTFKDNARRVAALGAVMGIDPCDPLGDHMARCTDPECQVCNRPKLSLVKAGVEA